MSGLVDAFGDPLPKGAVARLGTRRLQQSLIRSLAFSADGRMLAGGGDLPLHVWDATDGRVLHTPRATYGYGFAVAFASNGTLFAAGRSSIVVQWTRLDDSGRWLSLSLSNGTIGHHDGRLYAVDRGQLLRARTFSQWEASVLEGAGPPDAGDPAGFGGSRVAIATQRGDVRVYDLGGATLRTRVQLGAVATSVALTASGNTLAAGFPDGRIGVFDVPTKRQLAEWPAHPAAVSALAFSPDGATIASGGGSRVRLWSTASGGERLSLPTFEEPPARLSFRPDAPRIVTRSGASLQEWDADSGAELSMVPARGLWDDGARIPEARFVAVEDGAAKWSIWDTAIGRETFRIEVNGVAAVSVAGDLCATVDLDHEVQLLELPRGAARWSRALPDSFRERPTFARVLPGNEWVLVGRTYDRIWLLDARNGHTERVLDGPVAFSRDGRLLASTTGNGGDVPRGVEVYSVRDHGRGWVARCHMRAGSGPTRALAFAPFRPLLAAAIAPDVIHVWNVEKQPRKTHVAYKGTEAHDLVFSPDARRLASISWTTSDVLIWDVPA